MHTLTADRMLSDGPTVGLVVVVGALVAHQPAAAVGLAVLVILYAVSRVAPVAILVALLAMTVIVPFGTQQTIVNWVQDRIGFGAGAGLILSDLLLFAGLLGTSRQLTWSRLPRRVRRAAVVVVVFTGIATLQFLRGLAAGRDLSLVGYELRVLLGYSAFLIALPVLLDPIQRRRLLTAVLFVGLALGLWGMAQWIFGFEFTESADAGVRAGVRMTSSGKGQLQGGLFGFPVAVLLSLGGLLSGRVRSGRARMLLVSILVLNLACLILTYERSLWIATAMGAGFVVLKFGAAQRYRAVVWGSAVLLVVLAGMATLAPNELSAARERLLSLSQYGSDDSLRYRTTESRYVSREVLERPVAGSGLGASIFWGQPWDLQSPARDTFAHNGYLWMAWKLGVPAALLLTALLVASLKLFEHRGRTDLFGGVQKGSRGALLALGLANVTFPSLNQLSITVTLGLLMAISLVSVRQDG